MVLVPGFDERLQQALSRQATAAGESVETYVQRAVIARVVADLTRNGDDDLVGLLQQLATVGARGRSGEPASAVEAVVRDPARLRALEATGLLDSPPEASYDRLVALAVEALTVPGAAVSLVDRHRQFFKSSFGLTDAITAKRETPIENSICQYAVAAGEPFVIEDARIDPQLRDHPAVVDGTIVAYAGIPLVDGGGHAIGTFCVWDDKPRQWSTGHVRVLTDLAGVVRERVYGPVAVAEPPRA